RAPNLSAKPISVEPMPVANAPTAPYMQVWELAPTMISPGAARPFSRTTWWQTPSVISWIMAPSMGVMTTSPALISLPHFREKIFSTIVAPMLYRLYYTLCRHMYFGGSFSFQLYPCLFTGFFLIIANSFAVKAIFNRPGLQYPVGYTMRKTAVLTFALVVLTLALIGCAAADSTNDHVIQVSGSGSVTGTPDRVQISFAVETENADVRIAQSNNALAMNNVMDALAASGVPRDDIKTTGYSITPVYQQDSSGIFSGTVKTYQVTNTLQVTLKDTNTTGQVIDTAVNA